MTTTISALLAKEHIADLRRHAGARADTSSVRRVPGQRVELRLAEPAEAHVVRRLAALDEARELEGPVLLALLDGDAVAGLSLDDHRVVADPFVATGEAVALLRLRADHLSSAPAHRRLPRLPRLRVA